MTPVSFSIVRVEPNDDGDTLTYRDLRYGYDSFEEAREELQAVAGVEGLELEQVAIIRVWHGDDLKREQNA